jgi:hypothetical protein
MSAPKLRVVEAAQTILFGHYLVQLPATRPQFRESRFAASANVLYAGFAAAARSAIAFIDKPSLEKRDLDTCVREHILCRVCGCFLLQFCGNAQGPREGKRKLGGAEPRPILPELIVLPATASCGQPSSSPFDPHTDWNVCLREYSMDIEF